MPSASRVNWAKFRVSMVSIVAIAIMLTLFYLLAGGTLLKVNATLYTYIPDATGLSEASPVRVNGIDVGKVEAVALTGSSQSGRVIRVSMKIEQDHLQDIPVDSFAETTADNVVGDKYVLITRGASPTKVQPGSEIPFRAQPELLKSLDIEQFAKRVRTVDATLTDIEQGRTEFGRFVQGEDVYNEVRRRLAMLERDFQSAIKAGTTAGDMIYTDRLYRQIRDPLVRVDNSLARLQAGQGDLGRLLQDDAQYGQLRDTIANLRQSISRIEKNAFLQSDEQYAEWGRTLASLIRTVDEARAGPLFSTSAEYDNLNGLARELRDTMREFRQDPRKFMRFKLF